MIILTTSTTRKQATVNNSFLNRQEPNKKIKDIRKKTIKEYIPLISPIMPISLMNPINFMAQ